MNVEPPWRPSRQEQHVLWYLQATMRYLVGGGGLVWETLKDRLHEPLALLVFGAIASSTDVFQFVHDLVRTAREERDAVSKVVEQESNP